MGKKEDDEQSLDFTKQLVDAYRVANVELLERISITKNSYKESAKEHELVKEIQRDIASTGKHKKMLMIFEAELSAEMADSRDIEKQRLQIAKDLIALSVDKKLAEEASSTAVGTEKEMYQDLVKEIDEATNSLKKMDEAAGGVEEKAQKLEDKTGWFGAMDKLTGGKLGKVSDVFEGAAKASKKVALDQDNAKKATVERNKIEKISFKGKGGKDQTRFRYKKGMDKGGIKGGQRFVSKDKVAGLEKTMGKGGGGMAKRMGAAFKKVFKMLGPMIKKLLGPIGILLELVEAFGKVDSELVEMSKSMNMSKAAAGELRGQMALSASQSNDLFVTTSKMVKAQATLNDALGLAVAFNGDILVKATQLLEKVKLTGAAVAGLAGQSIVAGKPMKEMYENSLLLSHEMQRGAKIPLDMRKVLEAVGKTQGVIRAQLQGSTEEITKAVTQAKLLGMELSDVASAGRTMLDFESSIQAELEAELLIGKQLNLEKARLAALTGDYETLTREIAKNAGDFTEFTGMNVLQQEALAKSLGMQADQLADILFKQETQGKTARELRAMGKEDLALSLEKTTAQDKFNAAMDKLKGLLADLVTPLIPLLDMIMSIVNPILKLLTFLDPIVKAVTFLVTSLVDGLGWLTSFGTREDGATKSAWKDLGSSFVNSGEMLGMPVGNNKSTKSSKTGYAYADEGIAQTPQIAALAENGPEVVLNASRLDGMGSGETNLLLKQLIAKESNVTIDNKFVHDSHNDANYYNGPRSREKSNTGIYG